ncbi:hypothetical protein Gpo141_00008538 [Globisporangium polare]
MLGLKYVVAKSKELQTKLERTTTGAAAASSSNTSASPSSRYSARSALSTSGATAADTSVEEKENATRTRGVSSPTSGRNEGDDFLKLQQKQWEKALTKHEQMLGSGEKLGDALGVARKKLQDQVESEQFIQQNFHQVSKVREQIARMRGLVAKIAEDIEDVEQFLVQKTEEYMAAQNASFAARQQEEIELFELRILDEKEDLKRQLLEERREQLAQAFQNDIKTYQTLVTYQGESLPKTVISEEAYTPETLESIDLIVTADAEQLDAFYLSASEEESDIEVESLESTPSPRARDQQEQAQAEASLDSTQEEVASRDQEQAKPVEVSDLSEKEEEEEAKEGEQEQEDDGKENEETKSVEAVAS